jgi:hypothetical protein
MPKPRDWKKINKTRWDLYMDIFDDTNKILDDLDYQVYLLIDKARMALHLLMQEKADKFKEDK